MVSEGNSPRLPVGYTELAYLGCTGTQYLLTSYKPNNNTVLKTKVYISSSSCNPFFVRWGGEPEYPSFGVNIGSTSNFNYYYGNISDGKNGIFSSSQYSRNTEYEFEFGLAEIKLGTRTKSISRGTFTSPLAMPIGAWNNQGTITNPLKGRLYTLVIEENGNKIMELVPAMRDSDNVVGMYDIVGRTFLTNAGSGTFNYGTL